MKSPVSSILFLLMYWLILSVCVGYKPFKGTITEKSDDNTDPDNPHRDHGRSVYDPEIFNRYKGIQFQDGIPNETEYEERKEKGPQLPSYPWRGGGHEPLPLDDPEQAEDDWKEQEYIIGFRDCEEVLGLRRRDNGDDDDDDDDGEGDGENDNRYNRPGKTSADRHQDELEYDPCKDIILEDVDLEESELVTESTEEDTNFNWEGVEAASVSFGDTYTDEIIARS